MNSPLLGKVIVEILLTSGVRDMLLAPSSHSALVPLALHAAETAGLLDLHVRIDECVAVFTAFGMAKVSGRVVAVVIISGAAAGDLVLVAMEAHVSGIPLLLPIVDRPVYLAGTGANQACNQLGILGPATAEVLWLASGTGTEPAWCTTIARACTPATGIRTRRLGPAQVNMEFKTPPVDAATPAPEPQQVRPVVAPSAGAEVYEAAGVARTAVLAGDAFPVVGAEARATAEVAGVPPLAELSSNAHTGSAVPRYRKLLPVLGFEIERMVVFGYPILSRPVTELLGRGDTELIIVTPHANRINPGYTTARVVDRVLLPPGNLAWLARWRGSGNATPRKPQELTGEIVTVEVVAAARPGENLVFGASLSIRYADPALVNPNPGLCWANRGLAGVDGTVTTTIGIVLTIGMPTTLLLGGLALQHDLGTLVTPDAGREVCLRVILLDDHGGAIFVSLEQRQPVLVASFSRVLRTPQGVELGLVVRSMGWRMSEVTCI